jgi:stringent starvation protein B
MNTAKPYLVRALIDWLNDYNYIAHMAINYRQLVIDDGYVPENWVVDNIVTLNIGKNATNNLKFGTTGVSLTISQNNQAIVCDIPYSSILGIFDKSTRKGMIFPPPNPIEVTTINEEKEEVSQILKIDNNVVHVNFGKK